MILWSELSDICLPIPKDLPSPPRTPSYTVQQYDRDSVTLTVQWQPPQYDGGAPVNYTITVSPGVGTFTTSGTSVPVTVPYNVIHTVSVVATNCNGSSSAVLVTLPGIGRLLCYRIFPYQGCRSGVAEVTCVRMEHIGVGACPPWK